MKFEKGDIVYWMGINKAFGIAVGECEHFKGSYKLYANGSYDTHTSCSYKNLRHATHDEKGLLITALAKENKYYCEKTKTIKEMKKEFTKKDLKSGMWVELRNGDMCMVLNFDNRMLLIEKGSFHLLDREYYDCLKRNLHEFEFWDICKVYKPNGCSNILSGDISKMTLIWERETEEDKQIKEMQNKLSEMKKAYNELEKNISETIDKLNGLKK